MDTKLPILSYAVGLAGINTETAQGPEVFKQSIHIKNLQNHLQWDDIFAIEKKSRVDEALADVNLRLAKKAAQLAQQKKFFLLLGGDHTSAIGLWSGIYDALYQQGELGLIWIDAHMDSHTPETTESGRVHGMPLACLLGYGYPTLTQILHANPKLKPENVCLIGVRSYESGEAALLKKLNVRIYFMPEIKERGLKTVLQEAAAIVSRHTIGYGVSLDLDAIDPLDAPGVDAPAADGIRAADLCAALPSIAADPKLIAGEIVEFNPTRDQDEKTAKIITTLLEIFLQSKM